LKDTIPFHLIAGDWILSGQPKKRMVDSNIPRLRQDLPPPGGFPNFEHTIQKNLPVRGPSGLALLGISVLITSYGFYKIVQGKKIERERTEEIRELRLNLLPLLQAESDRRYLKIKSIQDRVEGEIMKEVPDWIVGENPYRTRWMPPRRPFG